MSRSRSRLAADWFAKLRVNSTTQAVEHTDVEVVDAATTAALTAKADVTYVDTAINNIPPSNNASALTTGTLPDGRFPAILPAVSGANLTGLVTDPTMGGDLSGTASNAQIVAGAIGASEIGNDVVNSQHYAAGSIDNEHIADNAINSEHYADGSIDRVHLAADVIDGTKIANDVINSEHYVSGSIDAEHIANNAVTDAKISGMSSSKLIGALPAISGSALTNLPSSPSIGVGQTWQTVSRSSGVNYTNSTGKPIYCSIRSGSVQNPGMNFYVGGVSRAYHSTNAGGRFFICCVVPAGEVYKMTGSVGTWWELR